MHQSNISDSQASESGGFTAPPPLTNISAAPGTHHVSDGSHNVQGQNALRILVLGGTGSGKSSFIRLATGGDVQVGDGADPCTLTCTSYIDETGRFELIDTPGFDNPFRSNHEILAEVSKWTHRVDGVLYMHRMNDVRVIDHSRLNLDVFKALCGTEFYHRVVVCSTMWNMAAPGAEALCRNRDRVDELLDPRSIFGDLMDGGAKYREFWADHPDSGRNVLACFENLQPPLMAIQRELRSRSRNLRDTAASSVIADEERKRERAKWVIREGSSRPHEKQAGFPWLPGRRK